MTQEHGTPLFLGRGPESVHSVQMDFNSLDENALGHGWAGTVAIRPGMHAPMARAVNAAGAFACACLRRATVCARGFLVVRLDQVCSAPAQATRAGSAENPTARLCGDRKGFGRLQPGLVHGAWALRAR